MKISCPSCEAKYSIGDDKVQNRLAKIRCRKCGVDIVIDGRVQPPTVLVGDTAAAPLPMQAAAIASHSYTIDFGENDQRAMTLDEVVSSYNAGYVTAETYVWADGMTDWTPLGQVAEIVNALNTAANQPAPQRSAPLVSTTTTSTKIAGRTASRGGDLFGALAHAGGEEDMARQAARDEPAAPQVTTGARNESSVLFSLSALTSSAKSAPTPSLGTSTSSTSSREDSGLIDLKALTAQASDTSAAASPGGVGLVAPTPLGGMSPLGGLGAPLGGAAPMMMSGLGASNLADISYPQRKNRTGLYIGGGIAIGAIAIALVFALKPEPPPPPKVEPTQVIVYKTREPEPIKEAEIAKPPPTGEPSATTAPKAAAPAGKWRPPPKKSGGGEKEGGGAATPTPTPPKSGGSSKCGCAAGDLACNMRCAAKGG